jgi:cysteine-dependent adenosine diphosphate thiazole synthase
MWALPIRLFLCALLCAPVTGVKRLASLGMVSGHPGMAALDMNTAEDAIVNNTREVVPGMVMTGMELAEVRHGTGVGAGMMGGGLV